MTRKTLKTKAKKGRYPDNRVRTIATRKDVAVGGRVGLVELAKIDEDILKIQQDSGILLSRGAYAKHAIAEYRRLRRIEHRLKDYIGGGGDPLPVDWIRDWLEHSV